MADTSTDVRVAPAAVAPVPVKNMSAPIASPPRPVSAPTSISVSSRLTPSDSSSTAPSSVSSSTSPQPNVPTKRCSNDFIFGKVIGEGSFSTVYLAKDIHTHVEYAIKVCEKAHIFKEEKSEYIKREKEVLTILNTNRKETAPFFVKLSYTFHDVDRLYFVMTYARNGELLPYINKVGSFDLECTKFYSAEILQALEHLHTLKIIHRDLKPENILLDENMHILITDFGSAKILKQISNTENRPVRRRNSFVGTAQYVSPELLTQKTASESSDLWALGCIVYQMIAGLTPFHAGSEYLIFQKITDLKYKFPDGFAPEARDLVEKLLVIDSERRLGAKDKEKYTSIKSHPFYKGVDFETLYKQTPPPIYPYLPGTSEQEELRSQYRVQMPENLEPGLDDRQLTRLLGLELQDSTSAATNANSAAAVKKSKSKNAPITELTEEEINQKLEVQRETSQWHSFVEGNLILKQGLVDKRKGLFARRRMLLLTLGPHLYYVDPSSMVLKGEIPWSTELRVEPKNFKIFFVHTPNRTYYLEDPEGYALEWCKAIEDVRRHNYGLDS